MGTNRKKKHMKHAIVTFAVEFTQNIIESDKRLSSLPVNVRFLRLLNAAQESIDECDPVLTSVIAKLYHRAINGEHLPGEDVNNLTSGFLSVCAYHVCKDEFAEFLPEGMAAKEWIAEFIALKDSN
jgi:hypothetical protein